MTKLLNLSRWMSSGDIISDCAKSIKDLEKLKMSLPQEQQEKSMFINIKA